MRRVVSAGERGLRVSLPCTLVLALLLVACGGPDGSRSPTASADADSSADAGASLPGGTVTPAPSGAVAGKGDLGSPGGHELEVVSYSVDEALNAEGGEAIGAMLESLEIDRSAVGLTLAIGEGGDPTISDWQLPGASAEAILAAWDAAGPGTWSSLTLAGLPALSGQGPDGSTAWAIAVDDRFLYVRSDDRAVAEEVARSLD